MSMESRHDFSNEDILPELVSTADHEDTAIHQNEPTILEYARFYGLCKDYRLYDLLIDRPKAPSDQDLQSDLDDPVDSAQAYLTSDFTTKERISISKDSAIFLKSICTIPDLITEEMFRSGSRRLMVRLKQEVPILRSDNEYDLRNFGNITVPDLRTLRIPLDIAGDRRCEGLEWPTKLLALPVEYDKQSKTEKMETSREALLFLQNALKDSFTIEDYEAIKANALGYKRNPALEPLTPPLLPLTPPLTPFAPSSPSGHLELLSELTDSTAAEARELDDRLSRFDAITPHTHHARPDSSDPMLFGDVDIGLIFSPLRGIEEPPLSPPRKRKAADLKVEGPLTPPMNFQSPEKKAKTVSFPEMLHEYIRELPPTFESEEDPSSSLTSFDTFFGEHVTPVAEQVKDQLENEKLQEFDTTRRVDVPHMDFSLPQAPWTEFTRKTHRRDLEGGIDLDFQMKFLVRIKREALRGLSAWHGVARLERELQWNPFPAQLASVAVDEQIQDDEYLNAILDDLQISEIIDSSSLTWKPEGLRILGDIDESEDELEIAEFNEEQDLNSLLKKRRMEIEEGCDNNIPYENRTEPAPPSDKAGPCESVDGQAQHSDKHAVSTNAPETHPNLDNGLMFGSLFSTSNALSKFMELQGKVIKKPKSTESSKQASFPFNSKAILPIQPKGPIKSDARQGKGQTTIREAVPLPPLPKNLPPCPFIVSATLLTQRRLTQGIHKTYPKAELIERDFSLPHSPAGEADLILSPSTGLILTNVQKIKQSALPGQPERSPIKERITALVERYERLIVFVSEGLTIGSAQECPQNALDNRDSEAFASLVGFSMTLGGEVSVIYLPGGEEALVRWIVCAMGRWGIVSSGLNDFGGLKLLQDETLWELFLRRAGLNAFAAQAVLSVLKSPPPTNVNVNCSSSPQMPKAFGLPALILMSASERVQRFEILLGGRRILDKVNALLDQRWPSAVNGFTI